LALFWLLQEVWFLLISLVSVSVFIYLTIKVGDSATAKEASTLFTAVWLLWLEFTISIFYAAELIFTFVTASSLYAHILLYVSPLFITNLCLRFGYLLRLTTIADLLVIIPGLVAPFNATYSWFFMPFRVLRVSRGLRFLKNRGISALQGFRGQIVFYWSTVVIYAFLAAGLIFVLENSTTNPGGQVKDLLDSFYFIVIVRSLPQNSKTSFGLTLLGSPCLRV